VCRRRRGVEERCDGELADAAEDELDGVLVGAGLDGGLEGPALRLRVAGEADAEVAGAGSWTRRAGLEDGDIDKGGAAELVGPELRASTRLRPTTWMRVPAGSRT
jgi:hypothetical protein